MIPSQFDTSTLVPFALSAVSEADLHKRLLLTMWNSDSETRYLAGLLVSCSTFSHHMHTSAILSTKVPCRKQIYNLWLYKAPSCVCVCLTWQFVHLAGRMWHFGFFWIARLGLKEVILGVKGFRWNESHEFPVFYYKYVGKALACTKTHKHVVLACTCKAAITPNDKWKIYHVECATGFFVWLTRNHAMMRRDRIVLRTQINRASLGKSLSLTHTPCALGGKTPRETSYLIG